MIGPRTSRAMALTDSQSPRDAAGKPASITSTPSSASARATRSFSSRRHAAAGRLLAVTQRGVEDQDSIRVWAVVTGHRAQAFLQPGHAGAQLARRPSRSGGPGRAFSSLLYCLRPVLFSRIHCRANLPSWISSRIFFISFLVRRSTTRGPRVRSPYLAVSRDELVHLGDAALVQQVDDQLQLVQALVVGDLGLVAGLDQRLEALERRVPWRRRTARPARRTDRSRFPRRRSSRARRRGYRRCRRHRRAPWPWRLPLASCCDGDQAGHAAALLILASHEVAGALRRDQHDVEVLARLDLAEVDVETVCEQQRGTRLERGAGLPCRDRPGRCRGRAWRPASASLHGARPAHRPPGRRAWPSSSCRPCARRPPRRSRCPSGSAHARGPGCRSPECKVAPRGGPCGRRLCASRSSFRLPCFSVIVVTLNRPAALPLSETRMQETPPRSGSGAGFPGWQVLLDSVRPPAPVPAKEEAKQEHARTVAIAPVGANDESRYACGVHHGLVRCKIQG